MQYGEVVNNVNVSGNRGDFELVCLSNGFDHVQSLSLLASDARQLVGAWVPRRSQQRCSVNVEDQLSVTPINDRPTVESRPADVCVSHCLMLTAWAQEVRSTLTMQMASRTWQGPGQDPDELPQAGCKWYMPRRLRSYRRLQHCFESSSL